MDLVFHIGYHKTATSWLQQSYFREHPEIALLSNSERPWEDKLLSYLIATRDTDFDPEVARTLLQEQVRAAGDTIAGRKVLLFSAERLSGHPFSGGYDSVRTARRIAAAFDDAKVICVVRNQRDMVWSVYKQLVFEGYPGTLDQLIQLRSWKTASFDLAYFEYDRLISQYLDLFGEGRVCVLQYELMRQDIGIFLGRLCAFLGVDYMAPQRAAARVNPSLPDASIGLARRLNYFRQSELYPFPMLDVGRRYARLRKIAIKVAQRVPWLASRCDARLLQDLGPRFSESNAQLARLLGDEFSEYGP
ncbi:MAG: sulfotransferase [Gammaproteobacteria bacterium]|nr:sulfotransferase [Gammaproteobacteria bacterium]